MTLLVRADAGSSIGTGHVMRSLALGEQWQREGGGEVVLLSHLLPPAIAERARRSGVEVVLLADQRDAGERDTIDAVRRTRAPWVVLDGYHLGSAFASNVRAAGCRVLQFDDYGHTGFVTADVLVNQNVYAHPGLYAGHREESVLLLGPSYAVLRSEFRSMRNWHRSVRRDARRVLVSLGGSDPANATGRVMAALSGLPVPDLEVVVLVGVASPHVSSIRAGAEHDSRFRVQSDASEVCELMQWADIAVLSGGTTTYEAAATGLPFLMVLIAEHQERVALALEQTGVARSLGFHASLTTEGMAEAIDDLLHATDVRAGWSRCGSRLIDGLGSERVCAAMLEKGVRE